MSTYRTPYAAVVVDHEWAHVWPADTREEAIDAAAEESDDHRYSYGEEAPLTIDLELYHDAEWCEAPEDGGDCAHECIREDGQDVLIGCARSEAVQHHRYTAAEMAAHLRERDDLADVLRLAGVLP